MHVKIEMRMGRVERVVEVSVRTIATQQDQLARSVLWKKRQTDGEILRKVLATAHERTELELLVGRFQAHIVSEMAAVLLHLLSGRVRDGLGAGDQFIDLLLNVAARFQWHIQALPSNRAELDVLRLHFEQYIRLELVVSLEGVIEAETGFGSRAMAARNVSIWMVDSR